MRYVTLRVIYPPSMDLQHVLAAKAGLDPFRRFGIMVESVPACHAAFEGVRYPDPLRLVAFAEKDVRIDPIEKREEDPGHVFGIVVTPHRLLYPSEDKIMAIAGLAGHLESGVVSFSTPLRQPPTLRNLMISMLLTYEAGHLLIPTPESGTDCPDENCLMRRNSGFPQTLQRMTAKGMDFCGKCDGAIQSTLRRFVDPDCRN